jgi:predicted O-methyltransferase YrrM
MAEESSLVENRPSAGQIPPTQTEKPAIKFKFIKEYWLGLLCALYLFSVGFLFHKHRNLITQILRHFGFEKRARPEVRPLIPRVELSQIIEDAVPIRILEPVFERGSLTLIELYALNQLIKKFNPETLFEMGTLNGRTTLNMAANCREGAKVYTLDLPKEKIDSTRFQIEAIERFTVEKNKSGEKYYGRPEERKITQLFGDTGTFDFSPYYGRVDFVFIDASHAYEYVVNDSEKALKLLRGGKGIIVWDDYVGSAGVTQALNKFSKTRKEFKNLRHIEGTELAYLERP